MYQDIPIHYVYKNNKWQKRSPNSHFGEKAIGRIISVSPKNVELYHLRLLLLKLKGSEATSFDTLKTFNNCVFPTFKEAAKARGLINDSVEWHNCLSEANTHMLPKSLRALFVTILCYCNPSDPIQLFNDFKNNLLEDFINQGMTENEALAHCVFQLKEQCEQAGFDLFLLLPLPNATEILNQNINFAPIITTTEPNLWVLLNNDQNVAASMIFSSLHNRISQKCFYLDGPGGSGKTFLYRALIQKIDAENKNVLCVAWTGIGALLCVFIASQYGCREISTTYSQKT